MPPSARSTPCLGLPKRLLYPSISPFPRHGKAPLSRPLPLTVVRCRAGPIPASASASAFSTSTRQLIRTTELQDAHWADLRANPDRLWRDIHATAERWGTGPRWGGDATQTGLSRLSLTPADAEARGWFRSTAASLSCRVVTDSIGNIFAVRAGLDNSLAPAFVGSHLDSQPRGGRFDGVLGVCAGIEMLRVLEENWVETQGPVGVVDWTNEEGARFAMSMMGSAVWSGVVGEERARRLREVGGGGVGRTVGEELERVGVGRAGEAGVVEASWETGVKMAAHFELHIEQGPHLVGAGEKIGVVEGVQAYRWYEVEFQGRDCHTGTTSFPHRADALLAAAKAIVDVRAIAEELGNGALASVGIIEAKPGSVNTVPGFVGMSLDWRCPDEKILDELEKRVMESLRSADGHSGAGRRSVQTKIKETFRSGAVKFQKEAVDCVEAAARNVLESAAASQGGKTLIRRMSSGAGHDSVFASKRCPTAMIFVPCKDGVSHHPEEWCEKDDCAMGASVLTQAVLRYDRTRR